jgi:FMN phosphatase YigB (HAD superfamily)
MIKAIFLDYHGVLDQNTYIELLEILAKLSFESGDMVSYRSSIMEKYIPILNAYASGQILPDHFWSLLLQDNFELEILSKVRDFILEIKPNKALLEQIKNLQPKFKFGILSDSSVDKIEMINQSWDMDFLKLLKKDFEYKLFSSNTNMDKQDPEFYLEMSKISGFEPHEIFYIDENPNNLKMAQSLGFAGVVYSQDMNLIKYFG